MGGFTIWAQKNRVRILRRTRTGMVEYIFNYGAYLAGKAPDSNILLVPDDTVVVADRLGGIGNKVHDDLPDLRGVRFDGGKGLGQLLSGFGAELLDGNFSEVQGIRE